MDKNEQYDSELSTEINESITDDQESVDELQTSIDSILDSLDETDNIEVEFLID